MKTFILKSTLSAALALVILLGPVLEAWSARLNFIPGTISGETIELALAIERSEKLAGMKVTIHYDKTRLSYIEATKTKATASFMHVVNDKVPGQLIIVMASATGISGDNLPLINLTFKKLPAEPAATAKVSVVRIELMDENLKEIKGDLPEYLLPAE